MPTLADVARRAGVSRVTASRVLNGTYVNKVGAQTRERVLRVVEEMNYHASVPARALRNRQTMEYGLLIPNLAFSFMPEVVQGLEDIAAEIDYGCLLYLSTDDAQREEKAFQTLLSRHVDGIMWMPSLTTTPDVQRYIRQVPVVQILSPCQQVKTPSVGIDQETGGYLATRHLLEMGHRRIAYVIANHWTWQHRLLGYHRALLEWGITYDSSLIFTVPLPNWDDGLAATEALLAAHPRPTAVIAANDANAWGLLCGIRRAGLKVPDDLSLVGFGNVDIAHQVDVPLTTVDHPKKELGQAAMRMLAALMKGEEVEDIFMTPRLVQRESVLRI